MVLNNKELELRDMINHPDHYNHGNIETIDYIRGCMSEDEFYGFCIGNCLKYISRAKYKGNCKQDLEKAEFYLKRIIEIM